VYTVLNICIYFDELSSIFNIVHSSYFIDLDARIVYCLFIIQVYVHYNTIRATNKLLVLTSSILQEKIIEQTNEGVNVR
jgi:hypothetical protein